MHSPAYKERSMRSPDTSEAQESKPSTSMSSSPKPYPVSIRAYRKKDYEYLMNFPRAVHSSLRPLSDAEHSLAQRDDDHSSLRPLSDAEHSLAQRDDERLSLSSSSVTRCSTDFCTSSTCASSVGEYGKVEACTQASTDFTDGSMDFPISAVEAEVEMHEQVSERDKENEIRDDAGDLLAPMEVRPAQLEAPQNVPTKSRPRRGHTMWNVFCKAFVAD